MNKKLYYKEIGANKTDVSFLLNKSLFISGASGLIGSYLIDLLMYRNKKEDLNCKVYAACRHPEKILDRNPKYKKTDKLILLKNDVNKETNYNIEKLDYVLHLASNTHPLQYSTKPIDTIKTNVQGTFNMLNLAVNSKAKKFLLASSVEVYGENKDETTEFSEDYCGYINPNSLRAGYPESKRCAEALCNAYYSELGLNYVIARISRAYGPTIIMDDSKVMSQFLKKGINQEDIVLKSDGEQIFSYCYVSDVVSALLFLLQNGKNAEAYNVSDKNSIIKLKDLATLISKHANVGIKHEIPDKTEKEGYSKANTAILSTDKINKLGWIAEVSIEEGVKKTLNILQNEIE